MCQLKLPQQVALTEFKGQVSATVKVIIVTWLKYKGIKDEYTGPRQPQRDALMNVYIITASI